MNKQKEILKEILDNIPKRISRRFMPVDFTGDWKRKPIPM